MSVHSTTELQSSTLSSMDHGARPSPWMFRCAFMVSLIVIPIFIAQIAWGQWLTTPWYLPILGTISAIVILYSLTRLMRWWRLGAAFLSVVLAAFEWLFVLGITALPAYTGPIQEGNSIPAFHAELADGTSVDQSWFQEAPMSVVVFFQGRWCPFCMTQLKELESHHRDFDRIGAKVMVVSVEDLEAAKKTQQDFPHLAVLSDERQELSKAVDLINPMKSPAGKDFDVPTMIVVDKSGTVRWFHRPKRFIARPSATELVAVVEHQIKK